MATAGNQLPFPSAPVLDRTGMHAETCECARCNLGFRPTREERYRARLAYEQAERVRKRAAEEAAAGPRPLRGRAEKRRALAERLAASDRATTEMIERLSAPVEPATPEQWEELRALRREMFPPANQRRKAR